MVIEIGPGDGKLTKILLENSPYYIGYEIDLDTKKYLQKYESSKVKFVFNDFLKINFLEDIKNINYDKLYIIGNLPYYITTPIITKLIAHSSLIDKMMFTVQKEVAQRLSAKPKTKEYGYFTVYLNYYFDCKLLFNIDKNCFYPVPKVQSALILLEKKLYKHNIDENKFKLLIKDSFRFKRKTIKNNLSNYNLDSVEKILNNYNLNLLSRPEEIQLEVYVAISNGL